MKQVSSSTTVSKIWLWPSLVDTWIEKTRSAEVNYETFSLTRLQLETCSSLQILHCSSCPWHEGQQGATRLITQSSHRSKIPRELCIAVSIPISPWGEPISIADVQRWWRHRTGLRVRYAFNACLLMNGMELRGSRVFQVGPLMVVANKIENHRKWPSDMTTAIHVGTSGYALQCTYWVYVSLAAHLSRRLL